ncbi:MAG TPA: glycosyl hydrolase family 18 protein [Puia sp.]
MPCGPFYLCGPFRPLFDCRSPKEGGTRDKIFISYDDERSVRDKCRYARKHRLAGVMFWEYSNDQKGYLLRVIHDQF